MSFDAKEEVMATTEVCCILVAIDEKGEVAVGWGGDHMLDQHGMKEARIVMKPQT